MTEIYDYDKSPVNVPRLTLEIEAEETIEKTLEGITYNVGETPNNLHISFAEALTQGEQDALDTVVSTHGGSPLTAYNYYCRCCADQFDFQGLSAPTNCPYCDSTDIIDEATGTPEITITNTITSESDTAKVLKPDGAGGVEWGSDESGGTVHEQNVIWNTAGALLGGNQTGYLHIGGDAAITSTETYAERRMPACTVIAINGRGDYASNLTLTVRKNGVDTGVTGVISASGRFRLTGSVAFADGDILTIAFATAAGGGFTLRGIALEYTVEVA